MEFLYISALTISCLLFLLLLRKREKGSYFLAALMLIFILAEVVILLIFKGLRNHYILSISLVDAMPALIGGLSYFYVRSLLQKEFRLKVIHLLHLLPFILAVILSFNKNVLGDQSLGLAILLNIVLKNLVSLFYIIASLKLLNSHRKKIRDHFSYTDTIDYKWLFYLIRLELTVWLIYLFLITLHIFDVNLIEQPEVFINLSIALFIILLSLYGLGKTTVFSPARGNQEGLIRPLKTNEEDSKSVERTEEKGQANLTPKKEETPYLYEQMIDCIESNKSYLNEKYSLQDLSIQSGIHSRSLSEIINVQCEMSFFDLINSYRIEEFNRRILLGEAKKYTILTIAYDCGFGSKSAFNRAYKKYMGKTPSDFIKNSES